MTAPRPLPQHHGPNWHKEPPEASLQATLLAEIRRRPGIKTDELAHRLKTPSRRLRPELMRLYKTRGLIGRQETLQPHELYSTWFPEQV
jgi:hypothetical protein